MERCCKAVDGLDSAADSAQYTTLIGVTRLSSSIAFDATLHVIADSTSMSRTISTPLPPSHSDR